MKLTDFWNSYLLSRREEVLILAAAAAAAVALTDWLLVQSYSIGILYLFPIVIAAGFLKRWQIATCALFCGILREIFSPLAGAPDWLARIATSSFGFAGTGLFVSELARNRRVALEHVRELTAEVQQRVAAQARLQAIIDSSLAPILSFNPEGRVLLANRAAQEVFGCGADSLTGECIHTYIPDLAALSRVDRLRHGIRTFMECSGYRRNGETFLAHIWISSHVSNSGTELAVILLDVSDQLREREAADFQRLHAQSRILLGGFWHEVRNLCGAINMVRENLKRVPGLAVNPDLQTLSTLVAALVRFSSSQLDPVVEPPRTAVDLRPVLSHLRIIVDPLFQEIGAEVHWAIPPELPLVEGDHQGLLQVFLNLIRNARTALVNAACKKFDTAVEAQGGRVTVRFSNSGPAVPAPEDLFQPFRSGTGTTGIGLYISRAIVRSYGGDLWYEAADAGACFVIALNVFQSERNKTDDILGPIEHPPSAD